MGQLGLLVRTNKQIRQGSADDTDALELTDSDVATSCDDLIKDSCTDADIYQETIVNKSMHPRDSTRQQIGYDLDS